MKNNYPPKRWLLSCLAFSLVLNACKKNHDDAKGYMVKEVYFNNMLFQANEYDGAGRLTRTSNYGTLHGKGPVLNSVASFSYNSDGKNQMTEWIDYESSSFSSKSLFSYNSDGRLTEIKSYNLSSNALLYDDSISYSGLIITDTQMQNGSVTSIITSTLNSDGNIVKTVHHNPTNSINDYTEEWSNYDDKIGMSGPGAGDVVSKNNPHSYKLTYLQGGNTQQYDMGYVYNGAGYVKEKLAHQKGNTPLYVYRYVLVPKY